MPRQGSYSAVPGSSSSAALPLSSHDPDSEELSDLETQHRRQQRRQGAPAHDTEEEETEQEDVEGNRGLLSGEKNEEAEELDGEGVLLEGKSKDWLGRVHCSLRTISLTILFIIILSLLGLLFHPSSPYSSRLQSTISSYLPGTSDASLPSSYYSGANLSVGTYNKDGAAIAANPLPSDGKFGDVPFASIGGSRASASAVPHWAGGDGGASRLESELAKGANGRELRWNGTHWYEPTVILISLDGVRADYLERGLTPHLLNISRKGLRAEYLQPVFPSLTFVNHWSIMTGLYPSSHGIVANDFYDPALDKEFVYTEPSKSWAPEWWGGEPIWSTAVKNGLRSAVLMWPGPPKMLDGIKPTFFYPFINHYHYRKKLSKLASWLDLPLTTRPHLITAYAPEVDQEGHRSGPHSHKVEQTLGSMDNFAREVYELLEERNLTEIVDVIFVSDHGMTDTHNERLVFLDDILGEEGFNGIERNEGWPSAGLRFAPHIDTDLMLAKLQNASADSKGGFQVFTHDTMPERWHFGGHERIAPIYAVPEPGWAISNRHDFHVTMKGDYVPKGNHGYDPADPSMHAIFCAHGPFANSIRFADLRRRQINETNTDPDAQITVIPGFSNLEVYDLVAKLLGIEEENRAPTNGTRGFWEQYLD